MKKYIGVALLISMRLILADVEFREDFWRTTKRLMNEAKNEVSTQHIKAKYKKFAEYAEHYHQRALKDKATGPTVKSSEPGWLDDFYKVIEGKKAQPKKVKAKPTPKKKAAAKKTAPKPKATPKKKAATSKPKKKPVKKATPAKKTTSKTTAKKHAEALAKKAKK